MTKIKSFLSEKGQTSVEYIMLIAVIAIVSLSAFRNIEDYIISNPNGLLNGYLTRLSSSFDPQRGYKTFILRR